MNQFWYRQADLFISLLKNDLPECGAWLDLEENYNGAYKGWKYWVYCLERLRASLPRVGIYTAPAYWTANKPTNPVDLAYFASFPLWIANYNVRVSAIPPPWTEAVFWQYGSPPLGFSTALKVSKLI